MAWRPATDFERALLVDARARWPQTLPLARALCLAPRIEPLLLRNARRRFAPHNPAEVESLLWFGPLIAARGSRECVLHLGVARLLAAEVEATGGPDGLAALWDFTRLHTRHWGAPERLERDLRYAALCGDTEALSAGLRSVLTRMAQTDDAGRLRLARLIKRTLPVVAPAAAPGAPPDPDPPPPEAGVLARYAALTLGDGGPWVQPGPPGALPPGLPLPSAGGTTVLGVELRWDPGGLPILHLTEPTLDGPRIDLPGAPPVRLHLAQADRDGAWYSVQRGTRIALEPPAPGQEFSLTLTSLDGRRRLLRYTAPLDTAAGPTVPTLPPLLIIHVEADRAQAEAIARWLSTQGIPAEPLSETAAAPDEPRGPNRALRLWTDQARAFWANRALDEDPALADGLLLRLDDAEPPAPGAGRLLDWRDWERLAESPAAGPLRKAIEGWWREGKAPALAEPAGQRIAGLSTATTTEIGSPRVAEETAELLRRIKDTAPESPEPLKIGDRLAALGDPRPGVGTAEREVAAHPSDPATEAPEPAPKPAVPTETERLIAELADPAGRTAAPARDRRPARSPGRPQARGGARCRRAARHRLGSDPGRSLHLPGPSAAPTADVPNRPVSGQQPAVPGIRQGRRVPERRLGDRALAVEAGETPLAPGQPPADQRRLVGSGRLLPLAQIADPLSTCRADPCRRRRAAAARDFLVPTLRVGMPRGRSASGLGTGRRAPALVPCFRVGARRRPAPLPCTTTVSVFHPVWECPVGWAATAAPA